MVTAYIHTLVKTSNTPIRSHTKASESTKRTQKKKKKKNENKLETRKKTNSTQTVQPESVTHPLRHFESTKTALLGLRMLGGT
jgi:hypothetical protein